MKHRFFKKGDSWWVDNGSNPFMLSKGMDVIADWYSHGKDEIFIEFSRKCTYDSFHLYRHISPTGDDGCYYLHPATVLPNGIWALWLSPFFKFGGEFPQAMYFTISEA